MTSFSMRFRYVLFSHARNFEAPKEKTDVGSNEQNQACVAMTKRKGSFVKFDPQKKKEHG